MYWLRGCVSSRATVLLQKSSSATMPRIQFFHQGCFWSSSLSFADFHVTLEICAIGVRHPANIKKSFLVKNTSLVSLIIFSAVNLAMAGPGTFCTCQSRIRLFSDKTCTVYETLRKNHPPWLHNLFFEILWKAIKVWKSCLSSWYCSLLYTWPCFLYTWPCFGAGARMT